MKLGQEVEFDEEPDRANGTRAVGMKATLQISGVASADAEIGRKG
jgi:hypothetical protein